MPTNDFNVSSVIESFTEHLANYDHILTNFNKFDSKSLFQLKYYYEEIMSFESDFTEFKKEYQKKVIKKEILVGLASMGSFLIQPLVSLLILAFGTGFILNNYFNKVKNINSALKKCRNYEDGFARFMPYVLKEQDKAKDQKKAISCTYIELVQIISTFCVEVREEKYQKLLAILDNNKNDLNILYERMNVYKEELLEQTKDAMPEYSTLNTKEIDACLDYLVLNDAFDQKVMTYIDGLVYSLPQDLKQEYALKYGKVIFSLLNKYPETVLNNWSIYYAVMYLSNELKDNKEFREAKETGLNSKELLELGKQLLTSEELTR